MLAFGVVDCHLDGAASQVNDHIVGSSARSETAVVAATVVAVATGAVGSGGGRGGSVTISCEMHRAATYPRPHLAPGTVSGSPTIDDCLFDVEPSFASFRLGRAGRMSTGRARIGFALLLRFGSRHFCRVSKKRAQFLDTVRRMRRTPAISNQRTNGEWCD